MDRAVPRRMWTLVEPVNAVVYFAPEHRAAQEAVGLRGGWMAYFASRAAPMGPVTAEVVIATFYNFHPDMVRRAIPDAWAFAGGHEPVLQARYQGVDAALRRLLGQLVDGPEVSEAAALLRDACAGCDLAGRPLFAANAALPWPDAPHLALWHATTLLREHRGDGHVAALTAAELDGCQAHVTFAATGAIDPVAQQRFRGWSTDDWATATAALQERGWLDADGRLTAAGRAGREEVEAVTDRLASPPWRHLGRDRIERLEALLAVVLRPILDAGEIPFPNPMGVERPAI